MIVRGTLSLHNNRITSLPRQIGQLSRLFSLDLRNNSIPSFPAELNKLARKKLKYLYVYNNPICSNGWINSGGPSEEIKKFLISPEMGCKEQCSPYCNSRQLGEKQCLRDCNSIDCKYQNGMCLT